VKYVIIKT